ncbi:MAG: Hsp20/alpha crystallin family protein [Candidatus Aenigmarchaeota archaeon]|nr:Hsp20/alpha crystallin family protein [Candidatus Aenigmarchaeota archaeon]
MENKKLKLWFENPFKKMFKKEVEVPTPSLDTIQIGFMDNGENLIAKASIPGYNKDEINLKVTSKTIELSAAKKKSKIEKGEDVYKEYASAVSTQKIITLPIEIDPNKVSAKFENNILEVTMKKAIKKRY